MANYKIPKNLIPNSITLSVAESATSDFEEGTWTFDSIDNFKVGAGVYAILPIEHLEALLSSNYGLMKAASFSLSVHKGQGQFDLSEKMAVEKLLAALTFAGLMK